MKTVKHSMNVEVLIIVNKISLKYVIIIYYKSVNEGHMAKDLSDTQCCFSYGLLVIV